MNKNDIYITISQKEYDEYQNLKKLKKNYISKQKIKKVLQHFEKNYICYTSSRSNGKLFKQELFSSLRKILQLILEED